MATHMAEFLRRLFSTILQTDRMPAVWRRNVLVTIFKEQGRRAELWQLQRNKVDEPYNEVYWREN